MIDYLVFYYYYFFYLSFFFLGDFVLILLPISCIQLGLDCCIELGFRLKYSTSRVSHSFMVGVVLIYEE